MRRSAVIAFVIAAGCGGEGAWFNYETRVVLGVPTQQVAVASLGATSATSLVVRGIDAEITYPLRVVGAMLEVDSAFVDVARDSTYAPYDPVELLPGTLVVRLSPSDLVGPNTVEPPHRPYVGTFEVILIGEQVRRTVHVQLAPDLAPCETYDLDAIELAPLATSLTPSCLDGSSCAAVRLDVGTTAIHVAPFRMSARVQTACSVSAS